VRQVELDHVGVVARDLAAVSALYEQLGFTLTPLAHQADGRVGNRCVILHGSYLELLAVVDPTRGSATLDRFLARYAGAHIAAFRVDDPSAELARLRLAGIAAPAVGHVERAVDETDPAGSRARFALIQLPDQPEGRLNLLRHLTPEALWQDRFLRHANHAATLEVVEFVVADPWTTAVRVSRLIGCVAVPDQLGGVALELAHGIVRILPADGEAAVVPCIAGLCLRTFDGNAELRRRLVEHGVPHVADGVAVIVPAIAAGGVRLRFLPGAGDSHSEKACGTDAP